jgi:RNA binding exosome subunit
MDFHHVELRCLANASEDPDRVRKAFLTALGVPDGGEVTDCDGGTTQQGEDGGAGPGPEGSCGHDIEVGGEHAQGQFGNPIVIFTCRLRRRRQVGDFWVHMAKRGRPVLEELSGQVEVRTDDELTLHFRLDKQRAFRGHLALGTGGDTIAVRCKPKVFSGGRDGAVSDMRDFMEELLRDTAEGA